MDTCVFFFKQKTEYEMRISDWSSDVCSSDLWFEVDATAYVGSSGRTALELKAEYDILLTQKLYLQPSVEVNFYGKDNERWGIGSGLTDGTAGLRLKYEIGRASCRERRCPSV